jgi:YHS domain-containing protein
MQSVRPAALIDPVCGMTVDVGEAEAAGLLIESEDRTYAFCRAACRTAFLADPMTCIAAAQAADTAAMAAVRPGAPIIDEGMRRWYESCSCCLSDAYPDIKAALDAERAAASAPPVGEGICEVAEREEVAVP